MYRKVLILCAAWVVFLGGAGHAKESPLNVDAFFGWDGCYRPMEWTPVEIGISSSLTEPFEGTVSISAQQDGLNTLNVSHAFVLTPDIPLHLPLVTKFAFAADHCTVRIADRRGKTVWYNDFDLWDFSETRRVMTAVEHQDLLIGLVGARRFGLLRLSAEAVCKTQKGRGKVYVKDKVPRMAPWDWTGYACLDLLVLYDPDYNTLRPQQLNAIAQWVSNGGRLLVVLGSNPLTVENPIARLLPFEIGPARQVRLDRETLNGWGLDASEQEEVVCRSLSARPDARIYRVDKHVDDLCLFAVGCVGFGRVAVLGFDPAALGDSQRRKSSEFWVGRLAEVLGDSLAAAEVIGSSRPRAPDMKRSMGQLSTMRRIALAANEGPERNQPNYNYRGQRHEIGPAQAASNGIIDYLYNIAEMRPLSIGWVILILTLLAILLGPVDYIVLKRRGRLPLTWVTSTVWIVLFTVGAYYGVQALRGGNMQMRVVSVSDGIDGSDCAWSTAHSGLFAPSSRNYRLEGLADNQWFSGITPMETRIYAGRTSATRNIYCIQHDGSNLPSSLPINIWTMQCLLSESPVETMPFEAEVSRSGNRVVLNIANLSDEVIKNGYVLFGGSRALRFGSIGAGEKKEFTGSLEARSDPVRRMLTDYQRSNQYSAGRWDLNERAYLSQGCLQRTMAIRDYLAHGAAVV
ncbi:MAG: hypothetical protein V3R81_00855, partial [Gammaproteobacteria bacterium]